MGPGASRVVYLVRHGRTALNVDGRLRGLLDPPLDGAGLREVAELGRAFATLSQRPTRIVSGPLTRTRQTAAAIASACGMRTDIDPRLVDRDYGPWAGKPADALRTRFGADLSHLPNSEPLHAVTDRALAVLDEQAEHGPRGPVVLVTHDVVNRLLLHALDPAVGPAHAIEQQTAAWNAIELTSTGWRVRTINGDAAAMRRASDPE